MYHRHTLLFDSSSVKRQLCMDELTFDPDGEPQKVKPTHTGPALLRQRHRDAGALPANASASSFRDFTHDARRVTDDNYARWEPASGDEHAWLQLDLGHVTQLSRTEIRSEYPRKSYRFTLRASSDSKRWTTVDDHQANGGTGSVGPRQLQFGAGIEL